MAYYIRDIIKLAGLDFKQAINEIKKVDPKFKIKGGPNTEIDFETFKATCQNNSIEVTDDGSITVYKDTDGGKVNFAPDTSAKPVINKRSYNDITLEEYNKLRADEVDPLKVNALAAQAPTTAEVVFEFIKGLKPEKTILNDALIHDLPYLKSLFQDYGYIVMPVQLGRRIRKTLDPLFIKSYLTDTFNNKIIVFNRDKVLYAFIINV